MSACFGACSLVGVLLAAPIPPRFLQAPAERRALAEQPVYVHLPDCVWNHREALFGSTPTSLEPPERERERDGGDAEAQRSHQTVCLTVPRGNQFNSPRLLASRGGGGGRAGKRCTCLREEEEGRGGCYCLFGQKGNLIKLN